MSESVREVGRKGGRKGEGRMNESVREGGRKGGKG